MLSNSPVVHLTARDYSIAYSLVGDHVIRKHFGLPPDYDLNHLAARSYVVSLTVHSEASLSFGDEDYDDDDDDDENEDDEGASTSVYPLCELANFHGSLQKEFLAGEANPSDVPLMIGGHIEEGHGLHRVRALVIMPEGDPDRATEVIQAFTFLYRAAQHVRDASWHWLGAPDADSTVSEMIDHITARATVPVAEYEQMLVIRP